MFHSSIQERGRVTFPLFKGERHYMIPFLQKDGLPSSLNHWQETVDAMLEGIETAEPIYFMADQSVVVKGETQRRPGVHVDGYWCPTLSAHRGGGSHGGHRPIPSHRGQGGHGGSHMSGAWDTIDFSEPEALLLASNVTACRAFVGDYSGEIKEGGDASSIDLSDLRVVHMQRNVTYCGTVATLHESLPVVADSRRTLVRLNCPGVSLN